MNKTRFCEHCGTTLDADARFCDSCGTPIEPTNQSAPPGPSAATPVAQSAAAVLPRSVDRRVLVVAVAGVIVLLVCIAIGVLGFLFWQSNPSVVSQLPGGAPQVSVVPTFRVPTSVPPAIATTVRPPTSAPLTNMPPLPSGVLFYDDFASQEVTQRNGWTVGSDPDVDRTWSPNLFTISVKRQNYFITTSPNGEYGNLGLEVEAQVISSGYAEYGLVFRSSRTAGALSYYLFAVTTDGRYFLAKKVADKWSDPNPVPYTNSQFIRQGNGRNALGVTVQGNQISLFINRVLVREVTDDSIPNQGYAGVVVQSEKNIATVGFSRFAVYTPEKARAEWVGEPTPSSQPTISNVPPPTRVPPTSAAPPGVYVTGVRLEPGPKRGVDIGFYPQFSNTTGGTQTYRVRVYLFRPDNPRNSFGETSAALITIPVGSSEQKALGSWKLGGGGGCEDFLVRVGWIDPDNRITFFNKPEGALFEYLTPICP